MARPLDDDTLVALARRTPLAILLDVDGTLAPIAPTPAEAAVPQATRDVIADLARRPGVHVALVSGRSTADALHMLGLSGLHAIGVHGAEWVTGADVEVDPRVAAFGERLSTARDRIASALRDVQGAFVEDKRWSLSVHYRLAARADVPRVEAAARHVGGELGLDVRAAKEVFEIRAPVAVDKGTGILTLVDRLGADGVLFAGDDTTDEDGFARLAPFGDRAVTVRVGPPETETAAGFVVDDPAAVRRLLLRLAELR